MLPTTHIEYDLISTSHSLYFFTLSLNLSHPFSVYNTLQSQSDEASASPSIFDLCLSLCIFSLSLILSLYTVHSNLKAMKPHPHPQDLAAKS